MEPTTAPVAYIINTTVINLEHRFKRFHVAGYGPDSIFKTEPIGWFVHLEGSSESLYLGADRPALDSGDVVEIRIRKTNAKAVSPPK